MTKLIKGVNDFASVHPELIQEWDYDKNGDLSPDNVSFASHKLVWWKCKKCGYEWQTTIHNRHSNHGCPICYGKFATAGINDLATIRPDLLVEWDYEKNVLPPSSYTEKSDKKVWWVCKSCGHNWQTQIKYRSRGIKCPHCQRMYQSSFPEACLLFYICKFFPKSINRYKPEWLNNREIDIYIPSIAMGIEYDGKRWHKDTIEEDTRKGKTINEHGVGLIRIREYGLSVLHDGSTQIFTSKPDSLGFFMESPIRQVLSLLLPQDTSFTVDILSDYSNILSNLKTARIEGSFAYKTPELLQEWNYEKNGNMNPEAFPAVSGYKVWWRCLKCGNEYQMTVGNRSAGHGCPRCAMQTKPQTKTTKNMIIGKNDLCSIHPELLEEWDYSKNSTLPQKYTIGSAKKVWWTCSKCGASWAAVIADRCKGHGCPVCAKYKKLKQFMKDK